MTTATETLHTPRILEEGCCWNASDVASESTWTEILTPLEFAEIDGALRVALNKSSDLLEVGRDDFPLPQLAQRLAAVERELINGRGFVRLRGLERDRYSQSEMEMIYWGIGRHLGEPWPQNQYGHVLGDVTDQNESPDDPTVRGNEIGGSALPFHCDGSDLVGLMCLQNRIEGGL